MKIIRDLSSFVPAPHPVLTIGNFDGPHVGHRALVSAVVTMAAEYEGTSCVLTFDPHPSTVLAPESSPPLLTSQEEKYEFFQRLGVERLVVLAFTPALAGLTPEAFSRTILQEGLNIRELCVGENFALGKGRSGTVDVLRALGHDLGFGVKTIPPVHLDGDIVSSTRVRRLVQSGDVALAAKCLGRPYRVAETVIHGEQRGASLGWPTANLRLSSRRVIPADGIYATMARVDGRWRQSVSYIGTRSTFLPGERLLEVHVFDMDQSLYGEVLPVLFIERLRGDARFDHVEELVAQIAQDARQARDVLQAANLCALTS